MTSDYVDLYERGSRLLSERVAGAAESLSATTPCDGWDVKTLLNHLRETQEYFLGAARGENASPPSPEPPNLLGDDPSPEDIVAEVADAQAQTLEVFGDEAVRERTGPALAIAFSDQMLHGWDLARATGQDATMPEDLAKAAYEAIHGRFTEEQRQGVFKPE